MKKKLLTTLTAGMLLTTAALCTVTVFAEETPAETAAEESAEETAPEAEDNAAEQAEIQDIVLTVGG